MIRVVTGGYRVSNEAAVMARSKSKPKGPAPLKTIGIKASVEWADWLEGLAKHQRTTVASLIDRALEQHAQSVGYKDAPPERIP
jgi:hypothetical protein